MSQKNNETAKAPLVTHLSSSSEAFQNHLETLFAHADLTILEHDIESDRVYPLIGNSLIFNRYPDKTLSEIRQIIHSEPDRKLQLHAQKHPGTSVILASRLSPDGGQVRWNQFVYSPVFNSDGREVRLIYRLGVDDLMEAQVSLEEALRFAHIETFEEDAQTGEGHFLFGFADHTGTGFIGGEERLSRIPQEQRKAVHEALQQVGKKIEFQFLETDSPELKWWEQQTIREYTNEQGRRMLVGMARRIHTEKSAVLALEQAVTDLEVAKEAALAAAKSKSEFLANMSHEIRTPLHAILGLATALTKNNDINKARELGGKIVSAGQSLQTIINDILDFSKIDAGKLELEFHPFDLQAILDNLSVIMSNAAASKDLSLAMRLKFKIKNLFVGDGVRLEQVLINLLSNAIKFTEKGHVILGVELLHGGSSQRLRFSVEDSGIGMSAETLSRIFSAFEQADSSTNRRYGGTGLGLTISSRLLELMGSQLCVDSEVGVGTTFHFDIELAKGEPVKTGLAQMQHLDVLIADDDQASLDALAETVTALGWSAERYTDANQLVSAAKIAVDQRKNIDLLLLDYDMPGVNGPKAAAELKNYINGGHTPCVVMVSAYSKAEIEQDPNVDYVDAILQKPVTTSDLYDTLMNLHGGIEVKPLVVNEDQPLEGLSLLVVDDNEFNRDVAVQVFSSEGAKLVCLEDGEQAVNWLKLNHHLVDAVLMDIQMPVMDGLAATRVIRQELGLNLPIAALSAAVFEKDRVAAMESGMDEFISKPFDIDKAIETILHMVQRSRLSKDGTSGGRVVDVENALQQNLFNESQALKYWGSRERLAPYLVKFLDEYADVASSFVGLAPKDAEVLAHKVKGTAAVLGMNELADESRKLMEIYTSDNSAEQVDLAVGQFKDVLEATTGIIRGYLG